MPQVNFIPTRTAMVTNIEVTEIEERRAASSLKPCHPERSRIIRLRMMHAVE